MFQIGDRVISVVDEPDFGGDLQIGMTGTVVMNTDIPYGYAFGVQMDDPCFEGHSLNGHIPNRNGYWIKEDWVKVICTEEDFEIDFEELASIL